MKNFVLGVVFCSSLAFAQGEANAEESLSDARDHLREIKTFIAGKKSALAISGQKMDMFGKPQDPQKAAVERKKKAVAVSNPQSAEIPLQRIVDALPVTMIDPLGDRVLMNGAPPIRAGETLEMAFQGQKLLLRFEGARSTGAYFRDVKSKKLALRKMTRLPNGVHRGIKATDSTDSIQKIEPDKAMTIKVDLDMN